MSNDITWAEHEAQLTILRYRELIAIEGHLYADKWLKEQREHMHSRVFENNPRDCALYDTHLRNNGFILPRP